MEDEVLSVIGEHTCDQFVEEPVQVKPDKTIKRKAAEDLFRIPYQQEVKCLKRKIFYFQREDDLNFTITDFFIALKR
ncbi:unnamed protein product [Meloidogyne enterolobii]|uniref:Uncharacterized protein n=1 Tax=Meloidogyne enterolobii TaxID=390850 RepID=A0ACB0ZCR5_MELEN